MEAQTQYLMMNIPKYVLFSLPKRPTWVLLAELRNYHGIQNNTRNCLRHWLPVSIEQTNCLRLSSDWWCKKLKWQRRFGNCMIPMWVNFLNEAKGKQSSYSLRLQLSSLGRGQITFCCVQRLNEKVGWSHNIPSLCMGKKAKGFWYRAQRGRTGRG